MLPWSRLQYLAQGAVGSALGVVVSELPESASQGHHPRLLVRARTAVYPWLVSLGLLLAWAVVVLLGSGGVDATGNVVGTDFLGLYSGASVAANDPDTDVYRHDAVRERQQELVPRMDETEVVPYLSPPPALLLYRPFTQLDFRAALLLWWSVNLAGWVAALELTRRTMSRTAWSLRQLLVGAFWFAPFLIGFMYGQATGIVALVWAATLYFLARGRELAAGATLALLAFKPQLALGLALPLLARRRWTALGGGAGLVIVIAGLSWLIWPGQWEHAAGSSAYAIEVITDDGYPTWGVLSIFGFWQLLLGPVLPGLVWPLTMVVTVVSVLGVAVAWQRIPWDPTTISWRLAMAATAVLGLLLGVHLFSYDLALAILAFWLVVDARGLPPRADPALDGGSTLGWAALLWALAFFGPYLTFALQSVLDILGLPATTIGVTTLGFAAASVYLWREALIHAAAEARRPAS